MEVSCVQITFDVEECHHPNTRGDGTRLLCLDCGSAFPRAGNMELWAKGIKPVNLKVKFNSK